MHNRYKNGLPEELRNASTSQEFTSFQKKKAAVSLPEILFVTSYPPRECGIASYSQDLMYALNEAFENSFTMSVCALERNHEHPRYQEQPQYILNTENPIDYWKVLNRINANEAIQMVLIQHEFGLFANHDYEFQKFYLSLKKPVVFVFHTVLPNPDVKLRLKVVAMVTAASAIVVMTQNAADILIRDYGVPVSKIQVIAHGTHLAEHVNKDAMKIRFNLLGKKVLSTFGLISPGKGIETTLKAMPDIVAAHPDVLFLILGITHPGVVKSEGEVYRNRLEALVETLGLSHHVQFVNAYLPLETLLAYLQLTDIYIFTSTDPHQAVSGTFSYALSSGCPVVSTPIPHAKELLEEVGGVIVGFGDSKQLGIEVISLLHQEERRHEISLNGLHRMASTAWQNSAIAHAKLFKAIAPGGIDLHYRYPAIHVAHIKEMTTSFGMLQFSHLSQPDLLSGYTLDDNARALLAMCRLYARDPQYQYLVLIDRYLRFIQYCQQKDGTFLNYVDEDKGFTPQNAECNLEDSNGRAIWALGYLMSLEELLPQATVMLAESLLQHALPPLSKVHSTRAMAFAIKGLYHFDISETDKLLCTFADRILQMYKHESREDWHWFEPYMTYGNSVLSEAMVCAFLKTANPEYRAVALESFDFLLSKTFEGGHIKVISNQGWHLRNATLSKGLGGEQPIDVAYTIMALETFYDTFGDEHYKAMAQQAFYWFLGDNHLNQIVYNPITGGCYDGVELKNVNLNQGAESTLSYLLARLSMACLFETPILQKDGKPPIPQALSR
jgi:glycosyltransferase involved in cell wall biosynthesis